MGNGWHNRVIDGTQSEDALDLLLLLRRAQGRFRDAIVRSNGTRNACFSILSVRRS